MEHVVQFLETSGLLHGRIPLASDDFFDLGFKAIVTQHVVFTYEPAHAIIADIWLAHPKRNQPKLGGVSVHNLYMHTHANHQYLLPDVLLGFVDTSGKWHWPLGQYGLVCNLMDTESDIIVPQESWPVFFTYTTVRQRRQEHDASHIDLCPYFAQRTCRAFWERAYKEFIEKTWAPSRLAWCLDHEESREFFHESSHEQQIISAP